METVEQSIQQKLDKLDKNIISTTMALKLAEQQKNKDQIVYNNYYTQWNNKRANDCFIKTIFNPREFNYKTPEVRNYKGDFARMTILPDPYSAEYLNNGSEGKYNNLLEALSSKKAAYRQCKENFKRGKRQQDLEYLQLVDQALQKYIDPQTTNDQ